MFRVLSEDELKKITRWHAPEHNARSESVARTPQHASPQKPDADASVRALLGSLELRPGHQQSLDESPGSRPRDSLDVSSNRILLQSNKTGSAREGLPVTAELMQASYDEGFARGYAEGSEALQAQSVKELRTVMDALGESSARLEEAELEHELIALSLDIARLVIRREITVDPQVMQNIVASGLEQLVENSTAQRVFLHPMDAQIVRDGMDENSTVLVLDDESLDRGGCRIETGSSVLNAGIEDWLNNVSVQLGLTAESEPL